MASFLSDDILKNMDKAQVRKIAIFRALFLGDMLCIIPAIRALKAALPDASVTLIGLPWQKTFAARFSHYFTNFIDFPGWPGLPEQQPNVTDTLLFLKKVRAEKFDLVLQMQGNGAATNQMCMLWGARTVVGLRREDEYCPDENLFPISEDDENETLRFLKLTDSLEIPRLGTWLEFPLSEEDETNFRWLSDYFQIQPGNYVCLHPGARDERRRWPAKHFATVGDSLSEKGYTIVLTGSRAERSILDEVEARMKYTAINTVREEKDITLGELASIIGYSQLLVSNDTGVSHIAAALQVPSVIIFSPFSDPRRWAPLNTVLHRVVTPEKSVDPEYITECSLQQLKASLKKQVSSFLLN
jgi:ADP-heptose:LPS heptosyltransferase